jgi:tryptophan synthase beta chain
LIEAVAVAQTRVFEAGVMFARAEGLVPAPESSHAIAAVIDEAIRCREEGKKRVLVFNLSGNGLLDLAAYDTYLSGEMTNGNGGGK